MDNTNRDNFDLETFVELFDTAITSDNPAVKKALKNLLLVASIVNDDKTTATRPLYNLLKNLDARVDALEWANQNNYRNHITAKSMAASTFSAGLINRSYATGTGTITSGLTDPLLAGQNIKKEDE